MFAKLFKKEKAIYAVITLAGVIGFLASFFQLLDKIELLKNPSSILFCNLNPVFSCSNILTVWQSSVFGFPNSLMCIIFFVMTLVAGLIGWTGGSITKIMRMVFMGFAWFFVGFGFWYLWQSIFVVGAICIYCVFCYAAVLAISGAWFRLNYRDLRIYKTNQHLIDIILSNGFDIAFWLMIATVIIIEAIIKFA
jgi:uncharacterized membrane protein